jgi:hypothetical protein
MVDEYLGRVHLSTNQRRKVSASQQHPHQSHVQNNSSIEYKSHSKKVPHQDTLPNPFHSYMSGIGLSFLSLLRHIQKTTGDIPSLPTPPPFDFEEPVNLIINTDSSVMFGVGYQGWFLTTKDETILLRGGGPDDGIQLQEPKRKTNTTQIRTCRTQTTTSLHLFQQKHLDSPDTFNNLQYDSQ